MIIAQNISKDFNGIHAVKNISFEVRKGQTMVFLGTSGCGKTTTLKMLNRLIEPTSGNITINGQDIFSSEPEILRRSIGYVSQNNGLFPHYTVAENIAVVPNLLNWDKGKIKKRSEALLEQLKLPVAEYANKYPDELSGGQKQRVAIARALVSDPPVLLMDEPFGALDPITRAGIRKEFRELPELISKTIVLVTHDVQEAFELGDQICLMDKGIIVQTGTPEELIFNPENDFSRSFFNHQRLQLELSALKFRNLWEKFADAEYPVTTSLNSNQSLWEGMETLSQQNQEKLFVKDEESNAVKEITIQTIQSVYLEMKNNR
ncbi:ATP-binding cassette domain-containing protein [Dyadobacter sp. CY356]|uniref:ABC transporter ATP-binding protein n=1 Tax=Dyadobacter sp. CY356 TaxID=2906442 RepID=UPI00286E4030|nr:ATP-binding cassette domain-containing protein [Dyadobacter sp. CY356]